MKATDELIVQEIKRLVDDNPSWSHDKVTDMVHVFCNKQKAMGIVLKKPSVRTVGRYISKYIINARHTMLMEAVAKDKSNPGAELWHMINEPHPPKARLIKEARAEYYRDYGYMPEEISWRHSNFLWAVREMSKDMPANLIYQVGTDYYHRDLLAEDTKDLDDFVTLEPWRSSQHWTDYIEAIRNGAVKGIQGPWSLTPMGSIPLSTILQDYEPIYDKDNRVTGFKRVQMDGKPYPQEDATNIRLTTETQQFPTPSKKAVEQVKESFRRFKEEFQDLLPRPQDKG